MEAKKNNCFVGDMWRARFFYRELETQAGVAYRSANPHGIGEVVVRVCRACEAVCPIVEAAGRKPEYALGGAAMRLLDECPVVDYR